MKLNFRLKDKSKVNTYLYADILLLNTRIKYSLQFTVNPNLFDDKKQKFKGNSKECNDYNLLITRYETEILDIVRNLTIDNKLTIDNLKLNLDIHFRNLKPLDIISENAFFVDYVNNIITSSSVSKKPRTLKHYNTTLNKLIDFETKSNLKLSFNSIDFKFYNDFLAFCKNTLQLAPNTIGGHIKNIKAFMNLAFENGFTRNLAFKKKFFKKINQDVDAVYLTNDELELIKNVSLNSEKLDNVRIIFLMACYTGLRISDYFKINLNNVVSDGKILRVITEKTNEEVYIPLNSYVLEILNYRNKPIKMISHQKFNEYLKEVCKIAGINKNIIYYRTKGTKDEQFIVPKYQLVTSHTARRSFATNAFLAGVPTISI